MGAAATVEKFGDENTLMRLEVAQQRPADIIFVVMRGAEFVAEAVKRLAGRLPGRAAVTSHAVGGGLSVMVSPYRGRFGQA